LPIKSAGRPIKAKIPRSARSYGDGVGCDLQSTGDLLTMKDQVVFKAPAKMPVKQQYQHNPADNQGARNRESGAGQQSEAHRSHLNQLSEAIM
jgi:hypothetical protein